MGRRKEQHDVHENLGKIDMDEYMTGISNQYDHYRDSYDVDLFYRGKFVYVTLYQKTIRGYLYCLDCKHQIPKKKAKIVIRENWKGLKYNHYFCPKCELELSKERLKDDKIP